MNKMLRICGSKETETTGKASQNLVFGVSFNGGESGKGGRKLIKMSE